MTLHGIIISIVIVATLGYLKKVCGCEICFMRGIGFVCMVSEIRIWDAWADGY